MKNPISTCRIILWSCIALLANLAYRTLHPVAWKLALFAGLFAFLWELFSQRPLHKKSTGDEDAFTPTQETLQKRSPAPVLLMDIGVMVSLLAVTGGVRSPFLFLLMVPVVESGILLGSVAALKAATLLAVLDLFLLARGVTVSSVILYAVVTGTLFLCATLIGMNAQGLETEDDTDTPRLGFGGKRRAFRHLEQTIQTLETEREQAIADRQQVRETYSEVARLHREQKTLITKLETTSQLLGISLSMETSDTGDPAALSAILTVLMDGFEARGGAIWMREAGGERLTPCAAEGNGYELSRMRPIEQPGEMFPSDLRLALEMQMIAQNSSTNGLTATKLLAHGMVPYPAIVALIRSHDGEAILGAVGLCDARGASRFNDSDFEQLQEMALPLSQTLRALEERSVLRRRNLELSALYDLSRLFQTATSLEQVNRVAVHKAQSLARGADTALYHFDRATQQMNLQTAYGSPVDLLDFVVFGESGSESRDNLSPKRPETGLKGWFNQGTPQISLSDLASGAGLTRFAGLPVQEGSFAATPIFVQRRLVGMMTHYSPRPHAFDAPDLKTMERITEQLGTALERTETFATLEQMAMTDATTGLASSRYFRYRFAEEFGRVQTFGTEATLLLLGLDRHETLLSRHGSPFAESLLKLVAQTLENVVPQTCLPARYDENRLAILLPHADFGFAHRIFEALKAAAPTEHRTPNGKLVSLSFSGGIASLSLHGNDPEETLALAEQALFAAQTQGGDRCSIAETYTRIAALPDSTFEGVRG